MSEEVLRTRRVGTVELVGSLQAVLSMPRATLPVLCRAVSSESEALLRKGVFMIFSGSTFFEAGSLSLLLSSLNTIGLCACHSCPVYTRKSRVRPTSASRPFSPQTAYVGASSALLCIEAQGLVTACFCLTHIKPSVKVLLGEGSLGHPRHVTLGP